MDGVIMVIWLLWFMDGWIMNGFHIELFFHACNNKQTNNDNQ